MRQVTNVRRCVKFPGVLFSKTLAAIRVQNPNLANGAKVSSFWSRCDTSGKFFCLLSHYMINDVLCGILQ